MEIRGKVAVVTGAASGIGRALCVAFAEQGAKAVVAADVDSEGAEAVAAEISSGGVGALGVATDVSVEADVQALVRRTEEAFGPIDVFCSNAGIIVVGGVEASDEAWDRIWRINVMSHVYAARAVLPGMLERGSGYLVHTASAAGLLTQLGSAPYSVTKHAVVALAEWLSITHGDAGVRVSCLCPQAVATNLGETSRRQLGGRPAGRRAAPAGPPPERSEVSSAALDGVLTPEDVAATVLQAMAEERFLILPHPEVDEYQRRRSTDRDRWLAGMRRLQARMTGARR